MKFAWDTNLVDLGNRNLIDENGVPIILGNLVIQALLTQDKKEVDGKEKFARYKLAIKIEHNDDIDISEASFIKEIVGNILTPLPVGRIWDLLDSPLPKLDS